MRPLFSLFQSHLDLAHRTWREHLQVLTPPYHIIDATCGNGYDSLALSQMALPTHEGSRLYCIDVQKQALEQTSMRLTSKLPQELGSKIIFLHQSHSSFPESIPLCDLIVYNLGYLPGSDKLIKTEIGVTLPSLKEALHRLKPGGLISITCYPGHPSGAEEQSALVAFTRSLPPEDFLICHHEFLNRFQAPSLLLIFKKN